jgi:hypothetical protein
MYPIVFVKRTWWQRLRKAIAYKLVSISYDIHSEGFEDFVSDNEYGFCPDCSGWRFR